MNEKSREIFERMRALQPAIARAHHRANRTALLEHARMGRPVSEWRDGRIVTVQPAEVFARYGLDEFGRPLPDAAP